MAAILIVTSAFMLFLLFLGGRAIVRAFRDWVSSPGPGRGNGLMRRQYPDQWGDFRDDDGNVWRPH